MTIEILERLKADGITIESDGHYIELSPLGKVTEDLIQRLRENKPDIIATLQAEKRRQKVLSMLAENPDKQRVYVTDDKADPENVILTVAIRGLATFEMLIPRSKYDPFLLLDLINAKQTLQH